MEQRDKDIIDMCNQIINMYAPVYYNPNGADETGCPFCHQKIYNDSGEIASINHKQNCAYLIAKDLSTGLTIN